MSSLPPDAPLTELLAQALSHHQAGDTAAAEALYNRILEQEPDQADAIHLKGVLTYQAGRLEEARQAFEHALRLKPDFAAACNNLALVYRSLEQFDTAIAHLHHALQLQPGYEKALVNLGNTLHQKALKQREQIIFHYEYVLPHPLQDKAPTAQMSALMNERQPNEAAVQCFRQVLATNPINTEAWLGLGNAFHDVMDLNQAVSCYQTVLQHNPQDAKAYANLGSVFRVQGRFEEAAACFQAALQREPDNADIRWNQSLLLLLQGNLETGWPAYECRLKQPGYTQRVLDKPVWDGSSSAGKRILVLSEQGYGDALQFLRYLPLLQAQGAHVIFECEPQLTPLLQHAAGIDELLMKANPPTVPVAYDAYIYLISLPARFGTTLENIPPAKDILRGDVERVTHWQERLKADIGLKVGLVWSGDLLNPANHLKACTLAHFASLSAVPDVTFYSLQKGFAAGQIQDPSSELRLVNLAPDLSDFNETAAVITNLDLVITVDTVIAHLAGMLERPVWILLPFSPDWRWLLNREDSPWYPTARLFRQPEPGNWKAVMSQVTSSLEMFASARLSNR